MCEACLEDKKEACHQSGEAKALSIQSAGSLGPYKHPQKRDFLYFELKEQRWNEYPNRESTNIVSNGNSVEADEHCLQMERQIASLKIHNSKIHTLFTALIKHSKTTQQTLTTNRTD